MLPGLSAEVELVYGDFTSKHDGHTVSDLTTFSQNYSVYYQKKGVLGDQRIGQYELGLGAQWVSNSVNLNGDKQDGEDLKLLYRGDITIAPGGLPFRLNAYSYDDSAPTFSTVRVGQVLDYSYLGILNNSENVVSGVTLEAGVQNSDYIGVYRDILKMFPRILIDYQQQYVRDVDRIDKTHFLERDLAFVSLNKRDNWFHYRVHEYKDYEEDKYSESEQLFMLGTVDHNLKRQWIHLNNWIKLSVDASYGKISSQDFEIVQTDPEYYNLNLFSIADYKKTRLVNYNSFRREINSDGIIKDYEIPLYASGSFDYNRSWDLQLKSYSHQEDFFRDGFGGSNSIFRNERGEYLSGRVTFDKSQTFNFTSTLNLESLRRDNTTGSAAQIRFEAYSNPLRRRNQSYLLGFLSSYIHTEGSSSYTLKNLYEQSLYGSFQRVLTPRNTLEFVQEFKYNSGRSNIDSTNYILMTSPVIYQDTSVSSDDTFSSETLLALDTRLSPGLENRVEFSNRSNSGGDSTFIQTSVRDTVTYRSSKMSLNSSTTLATGDDITLPRVTSNLITGRTSGAKINFMLTNQSLISYSPNRNFYSRANIDYSWADFEDFGTEYQFALSERSEYKFFSLSGRRRSLGAVYQEVEYEKYSSSDNKSASYLNVLFGASYLPLSFLTLGGEISYSHYQPSESKTLEFRTLVAADFVQFQCQVNYAYGIGKPNNGTVNEIKEHMLEATVRKTF